MTTAPFSAAITAGLLLSVAGVWAAEVPREWLEDVKSQDSSRHHQALQKMRTVRFQDAARAMGKFFNDPNPDIRILMAQTLGELGGFESARILKKVFNREKDPRVRRALFLQLAGLMSDEKETLSFLARVAQKDESEELRFLALNQMALAAGPGAGEVEKVSRRILKRDSGRLNRIFAAVLLAEGGEAPAGLEEAVREALVSPSVELRRRSTQILASRPLDPYKSQLAVVSRDPDTEVRENLCRALGASRQAEAVPVLRSLLGDRDPGVRKNAAAALGEFPAGSVPTAVFVETLQDRDPGVRSQAIAALESRRDASAVPALEKVAQKDPDPDLRVIARNALAALKAAPAGP